MTPWFYHLVLVLSALYLAGVCYAIYDPNSATTKPPKRREPVLPWYLKDNGEPQPLEESDLSRSPKWQIDSDESPNKPVIVNSDRKAWSPWRKAPGSEIEQRTEIRNDRAKRIDYDPKESQFGEIQRFPHRPDDPTETQQRENCEENNDPKDIGDEDKNDRVLYEGLSDDNTKPRKEKLILSSKPKSTVARYDPQHGIQCPDFDSTGQFVYPLDCKFFVNCWNGRAFVQPCAPGTLFNPDSLECDFPYKVKCQGEDLLGLPAKYVNGNAGQLSLTHSDRELLEASPKCPPHLSGMLPHPTDCTKFLQCAHGGTFIKDCGPGTVFNPAVSVCDWPRNVKGCENTFKTEEEIALTPPHRFNHPKSEYNENPKPKIECPPDYTGMLPHPETCKKFLQCAHGFTHIMDCGPGTAFNPLTSVCDWPYNVPGCNNDKPVTRTSTTMKPFHRYNHTHRPTPNYGFHPTTTTSAPEVDWNTRLRPTWIPSWKPHAWTTPTPGFNNGHNHGHNHGQSHGQIDYNTHNHPYHHGSASTTDHRYDGQFNIEQTTPGTNWPGRGHHHGHHIGHGHHFGHQTPPKFWDHPIYTNPVETYTQTPQTPYDQGQKQEIPDGGYNANPQNPWLRNGTQFHEGNGRVDQGYTSNRQGYGRFVPGFFRPVPGQVPAPDGNGRTDGNFGISMNGGTRGLFWKNGTMIVWPSGNITILNHGEVPTQPGFTPSTWSQQGPQPPIVEQPPPNRKWDQESILSWEDKRREWDSQTNVQQQNTADKETDAKFNQWAGKTNIFLNAKGHSQPGIKNNPPNSLYPNGIYVNINGTRGHFITKEIEINQGHSTMKKYGSNNTSKENANKTDESSRSTNENYQPPHFVYYPPMFNFSTHFYNGQQPPRYPANPSTMDDLAGSGSDNRPLRVPPATIYQPPPYPLHNSTLTVWNASRYYPRPKDVLQPPYYEHPRVPMSTPAPRVATTFQPKPATGLLPPYPEIPNRRMDKHYPSKPATHLQPPYYEDDDCPFNSPNCGTRGSRNYPNVPATNLEPPPYDGSLNWESSIKPSFNQPSRPSIELEPPDFDPPDQATGSRGFPGKMETPSVHLQPPIIETHRTATPPTTTTSEIIPDEHLMVATRRTVLEGPKRRSFNATSTTSPNVPIVPMDREDTTKSEGVTVAPDVVEPEIDFDVDVLDDKGGWKPVLVFENKTKTTTTESSVIMKINKKTVDVELFNVEVAPFAEDEPPFPVYYVPPVQPLTYSKKTDLPTPISGQVIRLRGGSGPHDGYVEVQGINPGWGIVCDTRNSWTLKEAHVVCRQLGYSRGAEMAWQGRNTKNGVPNWIAANSVVCNGTEAKFQSCKFTHKQECRVERDAIGVRCVPNPVAHCRKDEIPHEGQCYHLADSDSSLNHAEALQYCAQRNSRLLDIVSQQENNFVSEWLLQLHPEVGSIMTSGVGFTTLNRTLWLWEDSSRAKFRFAKWWPGWMEDKRVPPWAGMRPVCVVMKRKFPCHDRPDSICVADYFFWDTEDCAASMKGHSYVCERPYDDIGCTYGKGNLYVGNANVTASGKDCLPWADERVAHPLLVNVVNREVREKLKTHNYCRNPNPNKESKPWCFTGPSGQREHCDIPPCGNLGSRRSLLTGQCKPRHFECLPGECIPSPWVCDGEADCTNGADERACTTHLNLFKKSARQKLEGHDVEKWLNTPLRTCALRCKEADFTCRSFSHKSSGNICLLSDSNIGMTGALKPNKEFDYYEMKERSLDCDNMYVCRNRKCINQTEVCNGKNDCHDRSDEDICTVENLDYAIRLAGSNKSHEGRVEVKILGVWGQVCDDGFGMIDADVICKELGFTLGALEVRPGGFYGNLDPPTRFMVDQLKCRGNETSLRECDFDGWGVHNCQPEEAVGVVCKTAMDTCQDGHWKCDGSPVCIPTPFICDEVVDCPDGSDESPKHCDAPFEIRLANGSSPLQGRVEVRHHGIWGTVCDDDFSNATAAVICRSLGYGGIAIARKDSYFGPGQGPIWLDEVFCHGNETQLYRCEHNHWGQHNCDHNEDAGVICTPGDVNAEVNRNVLKRRET